MSQYIEDEDAHKIIVSAALIDSVLNATDHQYPVENFERWLSEQPRQEMTDFKEDIALRLNAILADSELTALWQENEQDYPQWKANIVRLIHGLEK